MKTTRAHSFRRKVRMNLKVIFRIDRGE